MAKQINIAQLFHEAFGIAINPKIDVPAMPERRRMSGLDEPYYAKQANKFGGREWFLPVKVGVVQLPLPLITVDAARDIVKRKMKAIDGELKTNLGKKDYTITVRGVCVGENGEWPEEEVTRLYELEDYGITMPISNVVTAIFGIEHVVVERLRIFETKGYKSVVPYQVEMTSDKEYELIVEDV